MSIFENDFTFNYFGHIIHARSLGLDVVPAINLVTSVHIVPLTSDGKIIAVNIRERGFDIPGGHIDEGEISPLSALSRELEEEASITIHEPILIDVLNIQSETLDINDKPHMFLYAAHVDKINDFVPNNEVSERVAMHPNEFINNYFGNKSYCAQLIKHAIAAIQ